MNVQISLFANLRDYAPAGKGTFGLVFADGAKVEDLIAVLKIPKTAQAVILVNGRRADLKTVLKPEDAVTLFPPMEGG
jgi:molybdopterin converting factor small subunit